MNHDNDDHAPREQAKEERATRDALTAMRLGTALIAIAKSQGSDDSEIEWYVNALEKDAVQLAKSPMGNLGRVMILTEREGGDGVLERVVEFVAHSPASAVRMDTSDQQKLVDLRAELAAAEETSEKRRVYIDALHRKLDEAKVPPARLMEEFNRGRAVLWAEIIGAVSTAIGFSPINLLSAGPTKGTSMLLDEIGKARKKQREGEVDFGNRLNAVVGSLCTSVGVEHNNLTIEAVSSCLDAVRRSTESLLATVPGAYDDESEANLVDVVAHVVAAHESREPSQAIAEPAVKVIDADKQPAPQTTGSKYHRTVYDITPGSPGSVTIDVYSVLIAFDVRDPGLQHAAKKILCAGIRGKASRSQDLREARDALDRAIQEAERAEKVTP